nr:sulfate ABC transporter ATP-binding protein [Nitrosomonas sp.]
VEISKERFRELQLVKGDEVFIKPRRLDLFPSHKNRTGDTAQVG